MIKATSIFEGAASGSGEQSSKIPLATSDSHKQDAKNQQELIHWHTRYASLSLSYAHTAPPTQRRMHLRLRMQAIG